MRQLLHIDVEQSIVRVGGRVVELRPKTFAVLVELARHAGLTVTRRAVLDTVWTDQAVTDEVLTKSIVELRAAIGREAIVVRHRVGYRLALRVKWTNQRSLREAELFALKAQIAKAFGVAPSRVTVC